jgi:hypothetical protein
MVIATAERAEAVMGDEAGEERPAAIRASDADRDATVARLNEAFSEGRLTLDEFTERMERAQGSRGTDELARLVTDLPAAGTASPRVPAAVTPAGPPEWHVSPIGGLRIRGRGRVSRRVVSVTLIGGADLDLTEAEIPAPEAMLTHVSVIGGVRLRVPPGVRVEVSGFSIIGGRNVRREQDPDPSAPVIKLRAFSLIGGVRVRDTGRPGRPRR